MLCGRGCPGVKTPGAAVRLDAVLLELLIWIDDVDVGAVMEALAREELVAARRRSAQP